MASGTRRGKLSKVTAGMPRTPQELEDFIKDVINESTTRSESPSAVVERVTVQAITPEQRLLRAIAVDRDLLARAAEVFDDKNAAFEWIFEPNSALDGKTPQEMSSDETSREHVFRILGRIEHGIIS